ncbi:unnamed protein product [Auanema sp. JU1783]|nr:unnamed protein product [Auanema sp. JU1783]
MAEFVEASLENLLPALEEIAAVQLLTTQEISVFVKRCRRYEYRLQKREKTPEDFQIYADYLSDLLDLLSFRRTKVKAEKNWSKIKREVVRKITSLLRRCCERFKGQMELWRKLFSFLQKNNCNGDLSKAYTSCLQYNNRNVELYGEAAKFELVQNASVENARVVLQLALRRHTDCAHLFSIFFEIEVLYVEKILSRREFLSSNGKKKSDEENEPELNVEDISDAILNLRVAEIVLKNAVRSVKECDKGDMLNEMWIILFQAKAANKECVERVRNAIETEIENLTQECKHSFLATKASLEGKNVYDVFDEAIQVCPTQDMYRKYLKYCGNHPEDPISKAKASLVLGKLMENGWATEQDYKASLSNVNLILDQADVEKVLDHAIKDHPESAVFWTKYIQNKIKNSRITEKNIPEFFDLFSKALDKISSDDGTPIWELLIDFSVEHSQKNVEKIFDRAFLVASPVVSSQIKIVRINYLNALVSEQKISNEERTTELHKLIQQKPNEPNFYLRAAEEALSWPVPDISLARKCFDAAVSEHSTSSPESWLAYIKFSYDHDVNQISKLHQRAMTSLDKQFAQDFITGWTLLSHREAEKAIKTESDAVKRSIGDVKDEIMSSWAEQFEEQEKAEESLPRTNMFANAQASHSPHPPQHSFGVSSRGGGRGFQTGNAVFNPNLFSVSRGSPTVNRGRGRGASNFVPAVQQKQSLDESTIDNPMTPEEIALLNKFLHKKVQMMREGTVDVQKQRADPTSPLHSVIAFRELRIKPELLKALDLMGFEQPSKIQEFALPLLLMEPPTNLIAQSQSGTGKTAAFVLTMLSRVNVEKKMPQCLCLAPTYELARQIGEVMTEMSKFMGDFKIHYAVKGSTVNRGQTLTEQVIIGTPGRVIDYITKYRAFDPAEIICIVLDEADVMISQRGHLDLSYRIYNAVSQASPNVQAMLFSATYDPPVMEFAEKLIKDAVSVTLKREDQALPNIKQYYVECHSRDAKFKAVCDLYSGLVIASSVIFTHTRSSATWIANRMLERGHDVAVLHGDMTVKERALAIEQFKEGYYKVLITTNVCARGIDVSQVSIVINYDVPYYMDNREEPDFETYIHRIGRTGRFGKSGIAINFVDTHQAYNMIKKIEQHFGKDIVKLDPSDLAQLEDIEKDN